MELCRIREATVSQERRGIEKYPSPLSGDRYGKKDESRLHPTGKIKDRRTAIRSPVPFRPGRHSARSTVIGFCCAAL